jgi:hypothetical protein
VSSRVETLPKNLIARLLVQDLNGRGFEGLLSRTTMHTVIEMGKTREWRSKGTGSQERQKGIRHSRSVLSSGIAWEQRPRLNLHAWKTGTRGEHAYA